jgi:hypothetical protein
MPDQTSQPQVVFSQPAADKIVQATKTVLATPVNANGSRVIPRVNDNRFFWAELSPDDDGTDTDFVEQYPTYPDDTLTWNDLPNGRTGIVANGPIDGDWDNPVVLIRQDFDCTDLKNPIPIYLAIEDDQVNVMTYCPISNEAPACQDSDANVPTIVDEYDKVNNLLFHADDFDITQPISSETESPCDTKTVLIESKPINIRVEQYAGNGPNDDHCDIKNIIFNDFTVDDGNNAVPTNVSNANPDLTNPPQTYNQYDVYFKVTEPGDQAVCECHSTPDTTETRKSAYVEGLVYINPCDYFPDVYDCNDNMQASVAAFTFGQGLSVTETGDCSTGDSQVTVDVDIQIDEDSADYMFADAESDDDGCYYNIGICTQDIDVVTSITCTDGVLSYETTTVTVLANCDEEMVKKPLARVRRK